RRGRLPGQRRRVVHHRVRVPGRRRDLWGLCDTLVRRASWDGWAHALSKGYEVTGLSEAMLAPPPAGAPVIGISAYSERARWSAWDLDAVVLPQAYAAQVAAAG